MYNVSQEYLNYINDNSNIGRNSKNKVVIDEVEYFSDTLKSNPKISHKAASFIGGFPAKTCEFEILNLDGSLSLNNKEIEVYKGLDGIYPKIKIIEDETIGRYYIKGESTQDGTPTPETPVEIQSVGDEGTVEIKQSGKNLLNISNEFTVTQVVSNIPIDMPIGTYTLSVSEIITDGPKDSFLFYFYHDDGTTLAKRLSYTNKSLTFNTEKKITKLNIYSQFLNEDSIGITTTYKDIMISEEGGDYEPYKENSYVIPISEPLKSLPNGVKDTIEEDGIHRRVGSIVLNGSESGWSLYENGGKYQFSLPISNHKYSQTTITTMSNCFKGGTSVSRWNTENDNTVYTISSGIAFRCDKYTTIDGWKAYLNENPITVDYELAEEVIEPFDINAFTIEWVKMGIFKAKDEDITTNETTKSITFKGTDRAILFDAAYASGLDWETAHTGLEIVQEVCDTLGIALETTEFNFASYSFTQKPNFNENSTYREVVSRIAEIGGEIAYISRDGGLKIVGQNATNQTAGKSKREKLTKENEFVVNTVVLGKKDIDDNIYYSSDEEIENVVEWKILDNPYVDLIRENIIEEVASHIIGMSIIPYSMANFIDDYIYDLNDVISVIDNYGNTFNAVVLEYETSSRIKSNVKASTQTETTTDYKIAGSMRETLNEVKLQVDHNKQEISSLATKTEEKIEEAKNEVITSTTTMIQNSEETTFTALKEYVKTEELESYKEVVSTQFKQTSEDFTMSFDTISGKIDDLSTDTNEQFQEIQKYIRFVDGNIVLGEAGNELTLKIQHNRISFLQNELDVAYFSDNKLYVKDGEFINSLQLGEFAFLPRTNGNLSFKKVGGN